MEHVVVLCERLIEKKRFTGLQEKMDMYLACDRLTTEEYQSLVATLEEKIKESN